MNFLLWNWLLLLLVFVVYFILGIVEMNCYLFDVVEGELEIVVGYMIDYLGMVFVLFFFVEYINMIVILVLVVMLFFGGWDVLFEFLLFILGIFWLVLKVFVLLLVFIWVCVMFLCFCYD